MQEPIAVLNNATVTEIIPNVFYLHFNSQQELSKTFLRFQEYFESPFFKDKIFTRNTFKKWYKTTTDSGKFTYYSDWAGFNIPSWVLDPFYNGDFKYITKREKELLDFFHSYQGPFYIVAGFGTTNTGNVTLKNIDYETIRHEVAHALYYIDSSYKNQINNVLQEIPTGSLETIKKMLIDLGYHPDSYVDEQHAYLAIDWEEMLYEGIFLSEVHPYVEKMIKIFEKTFADHYIY